MPGTMIVLKPYRRGRSDIAAPGLSEHRLGHLSDKATGRACPQRPPSLLFRCAVEVMVDIGEVVSGDFRPLSGRHCPPNSRQLSLK
jgi:hypothetical protein